MFVGKSKYGLFRADLWTVLTQALPVGWVGNAAPAAGRSITEGRADGQAKKRSLWCRLRRSDGHMWWLGRRFLSRLRRPFVNKLLRADRLLLRGELPFTQDDFRVRFTGLLSTHRTIQLPRLRASQCPRSRTQISCAGTNRRMGLRGGMSESDLTSTLGWESAWNFSRLTSSAYCVPGSCRDGIARRCHLCRCFEGTDPQVRI
jgi:hypothetical protein